MCTSLGDVRHDLRRLRAGLCAALEPHGAVIAASGSHPLASWQDSRITPNESYLRLEQDYQQLAREQLICGCHVHVGIPDPELAIQVLNRVRPWLATLVALAANSPFWMRADTGYASFRTEVWRRWPTAGTPATFADRTEYDRLAAGLLDLPARRAAPAAEVVRALLAHVRDELEAAGEWDEVSALAERTLVRGTGAARQRRAYERSGRLEDVVGGVVAETGRRG